MVEESHPKLSMRKQAALRDVTRSSMDCEAVSENPVDIRIKHLLDWIYRIDACLGSHSLVTALEQDHGAGINRKHLQRKPVS